MLRSNESLRGMLHLKLREAKKGEERGRFCGVVIVTKSALNRFVEQFQPSKVGLLVDPLFCFEATASDCLIDDFPNTEGVIYGVVIFYFDIDSIRHFEYAI